MRDFVCICGLCFYYNQLITRRNTQCSSLASMFRRSPKKRKYYIYYIMYISYCATHYKQLCRYIQCTKAMLETSPTWAMMKALESLVIFYGTTQKWAEGHVRLRGKKAFNACKIVKLSLDGKFGTPRLLLADVTIR